MISLIYDMTRDVLCGADVIHSYVMSYMIYTHI